MAAWMPTPGVSTLGRRRPDGLTRHSLLTSFGSGVEYAPPFKPRRVDVAESRYQVGHLIFRSLVDTPHLDIGGGGLCLAVLDFRELGLMPAGTAG
jgi:hypothetical protein